LRALGVGDGTHHQSFDFVRSEASSYVLLAFS
jgi:hypothetical protein